MYAACYTSEAFTKVAVTLCVIAVAVAEEWTLYIVYIQLHTLTMYTHFSFSFTGVILVQFPISHNE